MKSETKKRAYTRSPNGTRKVTLGARVDKDLYEKAMKVGASKLVNDLLRKHFGNDD